jgi:enamine deaminase RidA (YjgF/YER057c/UK114 family)
MGLSIIAFSFLHTDHYIITTPLSEIQSTLVPRGTMFAQSTIIAAASAARRIACKETRRFVHIEKRLEELGITLPTAPTPKANYNIICHAAGNMMYISGHLPVLATGDMLKGAIGPGTGGETVEHGYEAARHAGLNIVATLKEQLGDLDRVEQVVKVFGIVQSTDDFKEQHLVLDGCSDLIMEVFGKPIGYHARSAIGTNTLPLDISVEVEAIVQIKPE